MASRRRSGWRRLDLSIAEDYHYLVTVRQIIQEIEKLSPEERQEVRAFVQRHMKEDAPAYRSSTSTTVRYMDVETARPLIKEILTEHSELFRKLAQ